MTPIGTVLDITGIVHQILAWSLPKIRKKTGEFLCDMKRLNSQINAEALGIKGCFSDIDEYSQATQNWDLSFRQLSPGSLEASLGAIILPHANILRTRYNQCFQQFGSTPPGMRTFGLLGQGITGVHWYGRDISDSTLLSFHPTSGFEAISQTEFSCYTLSFTEAQLAKTAEALGFPDLDVLLTQHETAHRCENGVVAELRGRLCRILDAMESNPAIVKSPVLQNEIEYEIPALLLSTLSSAASEVQRPPMRMRHRTIVKAIEFIDENPEASLTIKGLCDAVGVSWRTLDYAFKEHFEVSPKRYLMAVKMNAVRNELCNMGPSSTITNIANRWGFWHMSQFAKEYRQFFGESPSETLNRIPGP